jgi:hypothetical protein
MGKVGGGGGIHSVRRCSRRRALQLAAACVAGVSLDASAPTTAAPASSTADARSADTQPSTKALEALRAERRRFQEQELITARANTFTCNAGDSPAIVWRDAETVRQLGCTRPLRVRWFGPNLREASKPDGPGRWAGLVEGIAPNGTPLRRSMTFFCRTPGYFLYFPPELKLDLPRGGAPVAGDDVWREHADEIGRTTGDLLLRTINDSEAGAILLAGLAEAKPLGRPARSEESLAARNDEFHLALKLKLLGAAPRPLKPPRQRDGGPAPMLREGTANEAGVSRDAKANIDAVCRAWAEDSGVGFATLVARRGVIVTHEAFGRDLRGNPVTLDYRHDVASITKSITAILFSRFLDQAYAKLDDPVSIAFPDYPKDDPHVPTFRQCFTHTSGLTGHGDFGGSRNPHLENILLNGLDANRPGTRYEYAGMGYDLVAKAMEMLAGKAFVRLLAEDLFKPLGITGDMPVGIASAGARPTAREQANLAGWVAKGRSISDREIVTAKRIESLKP